jgi:Na+-driven multidrug efflux pump
VQILAVGYGFNILGGAASQTGAGIGRPEFDMRSTVLLSAVNPILSIALVREYGAPGAAAGTSAALVLSAIYLLFLFHRDYVETSVWTVVREIHLRPIVAAIVAIIAVLALHAGVPEVGRWTSQRYLLPMKLAVDFAVFASIYVALLVAFRQVTAIDWRNFLSLASFGFEFIRHPFRERVKIYR